jgi:hypothetical protein
MLDRLQVYRDKCGECRLVRDGPFAGIVLGATVTSIVLQTLLLGEQRALGGSPGLLHESVGGFGSGPPCTNAGEIAIIKGNYTGTVAITNGIGHWEIGWLPSDASTGAYHTERDWMLRP